MAYVTRTNGTTYQLQVTGGLESLLLLTVPMRV